MLCLVTSHPIGKTSFGCAINVRNFLRIRTSDPSPIWQLKNHRCFLSRKLSRICRRKLNSCHQSLSRQFCHLLSTDGQHLKQLDHQNDFVDPTLWCLKHLSVSLVQNCWVRTSSLYLHVKNRRQNSGSTCPVSNVM